MSKKIYSLLVCLVIGIVTVFVVSSCGDKGPTSVTQVPEKASITGKVVTTDESEGIDNALVKLSAQNFTDQETYTEKGEFQFSNLDHGEYQLTVSLPQGYNENDELERIITIDGPVNIEVRADPVREQTATIQRGTKDTLATSSGVYLTVDATESDVDVDLHIKELDDDAFTGQNIMGSPVQIRFGSNNSGSASLKGKLSSSAESDVRITLDIPVNIPAPTEGTSENLMLAYQIFPFSLDDEELVLAYANGVPKDYMDPNIGKQTKVISHEFTFSSETEFQINAALARYDFSCSDDDRSLKELQGDLQLQGEKPLILIHGIQPFKKECKDFDDYMPEEELFRPLITELRNHPEINSSYRLYVYKYTSNTSILANSEILWEMMEDEGIEDPVIIGHSMGGLVARGMMLSKGADKVAGLITHGTPHEGTAITDLAYNINDVSDKLVCGPFSDPTNARYMLCKISGFNMSVIPATNGFNDLNQNSEFISQLKDLQGDPNKVFALGGTFTPERDWVPIRNLRQLKNAYNYGSTYLQVLGYSSDGMVPLESAIPDWTNLRAVLEGHHHREVVTGVSDGDTNDLSSIMDNIEDILVDLSIPKTAPQLITLDITDITATSARTGGQISNDGGADITDRGVCWSESDSPTIDDNCTSDGVGVGEFESTITDLTPETEYFVRAYATNEQGTGYGEEKSFTTEAEIDSGEWQRDTETEIVDVYNPATGQTWMDRNLGASRAATSMNDEQAYGDLYQWGRAADGHQKRNSGTTSTLSSTDTPIHLGMVTSS